MKLDEAIEVLTRTIHNQCEEEGEQFAPEACCLKPCSWQLHNSKMETTHYFCDEHKPVESHYADFVSPYEAGVALDVVIKALGDVK